MSANPPTSRLAGWMFRMTSVGICLLLATSVAAGDKLPDAEQLARFLKNRPTAVAIVMISTPGCPICEIVRREQLLPMKNDAAFSDLGIFEILMQDNVTELPLGGDHLSASQRSPVSPETLARRLHIRLAPTLLFLNQRRLLAEPLVGYASADFYWSYLNERLSTAREKAQSSD